MEAESPQRVKGRRKGQEVAVPGLQPVLAGHVAS
jgi:hypothetical protein